MITKLPHRIRLTGNSQRHSPAVSFKLLTVSYRWPLASLCCVVAALILGGCGGGARGVKVSGQVLQNGKPIRFLPKEEIMVGFSSTVTPAGQQVIAGWAPISPEDGTFTFSGPSGNGIPPGKYNVVVNSQLYQQSHDRFEGVFDPKKPPLIVDVMPDAGQPIIIDVGTRQVIKK
jgi:hypothetical protein